MLRTNDNTFYTALYNLQQLYGDDIFTVASKWFKDEDIRGTSCSQYKVAQYYLAFDLAVLIYNELIEGYETDYEYYNTKYNIDDKRKKLACNGIDLDKVLDLFGIQFGTCNGGIGCFGININFNITQ